MEGDFEHKQERGKETHAQGNTGRFVGAILPHSHLGLGFGSAGAAKGQSGKRIYSEKVVVQSLSLV